MIVYRDLDNVPPGPKGRAVTIGAFDGVHLGHHAVMRLTRDLAHARGLSATVLTFDKHPAEVVRPESAPCLLTTLEQRLELIDVGGAVDECVVLPFDETRRKESAEEFVAEVLAAALNTRLVVVGADFHFGYRRHGDVPLLQRMGAELGFEVLGFGLVASADGAAAADGASPYSSTSVRALLAEGAVAEAARILGRPHEVRGPVEHGDARGRELGFPTANVAVDGRLCFPADGVYAGTFTVADGEQRPAALSLGRRPTFYDDAGLRLLEAYVLDFDGDLYDQDACVRFLHHLRRQERFASADALIEQMTKDVATTCRLVAG